MSSTTDRDRVSRLPNPAILVPELGEVGAALAKATGNGSVPARTIGLVQLRVGHLVGSDYLTILHTGNLRKAGDTEDRIAAVAAWRDATCFTEPERAALALTDAVFTPNPDGERVSDDLYAQASAHYDDTSLTTLILAIGQVGFFLPLALIGDPLPGKPPAEQWRRP
ncbi:carboxymuconolactone decarboxylase family protein [Yinghuangia sp. ASG 101]|uniref:carboxymuconolactone decarboxylase family protein n=1 Tax=Yinghuangia sp. ASG 101 TaxID=2896848 RepID=UPI001E56A819|nr:carboxymuconolactone decarboxylase family protein [Yinghuangia sp. ASG 101]UGQ11889.1 carboxymuconolactone decarboxylase family protein [Yinghuangia sp. ASG 101]